MALVFQGTTVPTTGTVTHNSTAAAVVQYASTEVWRKVTDVNVLATGAYTVSGKNGTSYVNASRMQASSSGTTAVYNHAICIRFNTGSHTKLYLAGTLKRAQYAMSRVRVGKTDPQLYTNLYGGEGEGPGDEYLEYHTGWNSDRWISDVAFSRTITVPANAVVYLSLQGTNTTNDWANWGTAEPFLTSVVLKP